MDPLYFRSGTKVSPLRFFLGDYIAVVVSTDTSAHLLYTFNNSQAQEVFDTNIAS